MSALDRGAAAVYFQSMHKSRFWHVRLQERIRLGPRLSTFTLNPPLARCGLNRFKYGAPHHGAAVEGAKSFREDPLRWAKFMNEFCVWVATDMRQVRKTCLMAVARKMDTLRARARKNDSKNHREHLFYFILSN